jgi:hypothetical protein
MRVMQVSAILVAALCTGCVTRPADHRTTGLYLGITKLTTGQSSPAEHDGVSRTRVRALGAWLEASPRAGSVGNVGVGWLDSRRLIVPADCRVVIIVSSEIELASVQALLSADAIRRGEQCVIKDPPLSALP